MVVKLRQKMKNRRFARCLCGRLLWKHLRCDYCKVPVGPNHEEEVLYPSDGKELCRSCFKKARKGKKRQVFSVPVLAPGGSYESPFFLEK